MVYQGTGRPELARRTYAEIIRINRLERAALTVARRSNGPEPLALARQNIADLNLSPVNVENQTQARSWYGNNAPIDGRNFSALYSDMSAVFDKLQALAESMRLMSETLRVAAKEAERQTVLARAEAAQASKASKDGAATDGAAGTEVAALDGDGGAAPDAPATAAPPVDGDAAAAAAAAETKGDASGESGDGQAVTRAEEIGDGGPSVRVHIASFRSQEGAERGWRILRKNHVELLGDLDPQVREIDFGAGMGIFFRVQAGPLDDEPTAKALCERLKSRGLYCAVAFF